jgi:hypothetical protein
MSDEKEQEPIVVPLMCKRHQHDLVVRRLKLAPDDAWQGAYLTAQLLLFQWATGDKRIMARTAGETDSLSLVLNEIGCLACWDHDAYGRVYRLMRKLGPMICAKIARQELMHDDWPIQQRWKESVD